jgi:hypothetical protein
MLYLLCYVSATAMLPVLPCLARSCCSLPLLFLLLFEPAVAGAPPHPLVSRYTVLFFPITSVNLSYCSPS